MMSSAPHTFRTRKNYINFAVKKPVNDSEKQCIFTQIKWENQCDFDTFWVLDDHCFSYLISTSPVTCIWKTSSSLCFVTNVYQGDLSSLQCWTDAMWRPIINAVNHGCGTDLIHIFLCPWTLSVPAHHYQLTQQLLRQFVGGESDGFKIFFLCLSLCMKLCMRARVLCAIEYDLRCDFRAVGNGSCSIPYMVVCATIVLQLSSCRLNTETIKNINYSQTNL